jgi:hypothetical protein
LPGVKKSWKKSVKRSKNIIGLNEDKTDCMDTFESTTSKTVNIRKIKYDCIVLRKKSKITR